MNGSDVISLSSEDRAMVSWRTGALSRSGELHWKRGMSGISACMSFIARIGEQRDLLRDLLRYFCGKEL